MAVESLSLGSAQKLVRNYGCSGAQRARRASAGISSIFKACATQTGGMHGRLKDQVILAQALRKRRPAGAKIQAESTTELHRITNAMSIHTNISAEIPLMTHAKSSKPCWVRFLAYTASRTHGTIQTTVPTIFIKMADMCTPWSILERGLRDAPLGYPIPRRSPPTFPASAPLSWPGILYICGTRRVQGKSTPCGWGVTDSGILGRRRAAGHAPWIEG